MSFPIKKFTVVGKSMLPLFREGTSVLATSIVYFYSNPKPGDVVIASHPVRKIPLLKRITDVRRNTYFLQGDNTSASTDSRDYGWVERRDILAKVFYTI